jgi:hypothetical protein
MCNARLLPMYDYDDGYFLDASPTGREDEQRLTLLWLLAGLAWLVIIAGIVLTGLWTARQLTQLN